MERRSAFTRVEKAGAGTGGVSRFRPLLSATVDLVGVYSRTNAGFRVPNSLPRRCLTKPPSAVNNGGFDNEANDLVLYVGDVLASDRGPQYAVLDLLGTGTFGQVVKCRDTRTKRDVAVKVIKRHAAFKNQAWIEISILRILHQNQSAEDSKHIVRYITHFVYRGHLCLVFELLSINLYQFLKQRSFRGIALPLLRHFLTQLLHALNVLVRCGIIHCDLKPENILLNDFQTTDIKVIDFGSACQLEHPVYSYVQSRFYRSPEVLLGLPKYDSQIDMWSLGCVAGELFLGVPLFPGQNEMNMVARIDEMLGPMSDMFLCRCRHTSKFFNVTRTLDGISDVRTHELKRVSQYEAENNVRLAEWKRYLPHKTLHDTIMKAAWKSEAPHIEEIALRRSFVDLLAGMLKVDPLERLSPAEAMAHPFIQDGPLPNGQPWVPPGRPRRIPRLRPIAIDIPHANDMGAYANSAPALRGHAPMGHPLRNWTDQFYAAFPGDPALGMQSGAAHAVQYSPYAGSYIPPPSVPHFAYGAGPSVYRAQSGAYAYTVGETGAPMRGLHNGVQAGAAAAHMGMGAMNEGARPMVNAALPAIALSIPPGGAGRRALHASASRESLVQRVPSAGDLNDETMLGADDDAGGGAHRGNAGRGGGTWWAGYGYGHYVRTRARAGNIAGDMDISEGASPGNSASGGNSYTRRPPPRQVVEGVQLQSPRSRFLDARGDASEVDK